MHPYASNVIETISHALEDQTEKLESAAQALADRVTEGGVLHVFGTGHSHMLSEELFYRAGGPLFVNPILDEGLMLHHDPYRSSQLERLPGYAETILSNMSISDNDVCLIISNSGRNQVPLETAFYMKERGVLTLSLSSFKHSQSVASRHVSGKRLMEVTDMAFDNYGEIGDAAMTLKNAGEPYGPTSSAVGIVLVQTLISMTLETLDQNQQDPALFRSANLDGSDERNKRLMKQYQDRIPLLR